MQQLTHGQVTALDLRNITANGSIASCLVRLTLHDLNSSGAHQENGKAWFVEPDNGASGSLVMCCKHLSNLYTYLRMLDPMERAKMPHDPDIMPDNVEDSEQWREKLIEIADPDSLEPESINRRYRAAAAIERLADTLIAKCREAYAEVSQEHSIAGARITKSVDNDSRGGEDYTDPNNGPMMRL